MNNAAAAHVILLLLAATAGALAGAAVYLAARLRSRGDFGHAVVRDVLLHGGPFRSGFVERFVARDAPVAVRVMGALGLVVGCASLLQHLALIALHADALADVLTLVGRAEVVARLPEAGGHDALLAGLRWSLAHRPDPLRSTAIGVALAGLPAAADASLAAASLRLLRHRPLGPKGRSGLVVAAVVARSGDVWMALNPPARLWDAAGFEDVPSFVPAFLLPLVALATWLVWRGSRAIDATPAP